MVKKLWSREVDGQLPNWLNEEQKSRCYCDDRGWVLVHKDGNEEVIVASNTLNDPGERGHGFDSVTGNSLDPDRASAHNDTSYSLIPSKTVVGEGDSVSVQLVTTGVPDETLISYTIEGIDPEDLDNGLLSGEFQIFGDTATIEIPIKSDKTTENLETFTLKLSGDLGSVQINIDDLSKTPVYGLSIENGITEFNEGSEIVVNLSTTNVEDGTLIPYEISGSVNLSEDFDSPITSNTGNFVVGQVETLTFNVKDDKTWAEGDENLRVELTGLGQSVSVIIKDSSIDTPEYELVAPESSNEDASFDITLNATNVPANTQIGYTLSGSVNLNTDFDEVVSSSGSFTVGSDTQANSSASITFNVKDDKTWAEGSENLILTLDGGLGFITVDIVDSSIDTPVYELVATPDTSNEDASFDITLNATNVPAGTQIGYTLSGSVDLNADFDEVMGQTGTFTVGSDTQANSSDSLTFNVKDDKSFEEGDETLTLTLDDGLGTVTVNITDSSTATPSYSLSSNPTPSVGEGAPLTITLGYQNVSVGTEIGYNLTGSTVNLNADFDQPVSNTGTFIVGDPETEKVVFNVKDDKSFEEGNEILKLTLDNGGAFLEVPIIDDSTATPYYNLSTSGDVTFVNENDSVTISLGYQNLSVGTEVPYTIGGDVELNDFTPPLESYNGKFVIGDPLTEKVDFFLADDKTFDEGDETLTLTLNVDGVNEVISILVKDESRQTEVYGLSSPNSTNENASFSISLNTQFVTAGTEVPYTLSGNYEPEDFNPPLTSFTGTFIVGQDETLTLSVADDKTWAEGDESLTLTLDGDLNSIFAEVDIVDSSIEGSEYELVAIPSNVNEGEALTITLNAENVPANTTIGYSIDAVGGGISLTDDFDSPVSSTGSFTVGSDTQVNSSDSITFNIKEDKLTEISAESLILTLDGGLGTVTVPIADTSKTEIFDLESSAVNNTIGEGGDPLVITLNTQNIPDGTYGYRIEGITSDDLNLASSDQLQGNFVLVGGTDTITLDIKADALTEIPNDVIDLSLNNGKASIQITVEDTSKTPVYDLSATPEISVDEGSPLRIDLSTENVVGNTVAYKVTGIDADDLGDGSSDLEGNFTLDSNGDSYVIFNIKADKVTEDSPEDVLVLTLTGLGEQISVNINDISKDPIWDLTTSPVGSVNEGSDLVITLQTQNVDAGDYAYDISGSGFGPEDLEDDSDPLTGDFTITGATNDVSSDSITLKIKKDYSSGEGYETITISLPDVDEVDDIDVIVNDSSSLDGVEGERVGGLNGPELWNPTISPDGKYLTFGKDQKNWLNLYKNVNGSWVQLEDIAAGSSNYFFGSGSGSFTTDSSLFVKGSARVTSGSGSVDVYEIDDDGNFSLRESVSGRNLYWGYGVAISGDGLTMVVYSKTSNTIDTLTWDESTGQWNTIDIFSTGLDYKANGQIDMTADAQTLVLPLQIGNSYVGKVAIFERSGNGWQFQQELQPPQLMGMTQSAQISSDGTFIALGNGAYYGGDSQCVFFDYDGTNWTQRGTVLVAPQIPGQTGYANRFRYMSITDPIDGEYKLISTLGYTYSLPASINTYSISGPSSVDEGQDLTLTLNTLGVNGNVAYTISGIADSDLRSGSDLTSGNFVVADDTGSITLKLKEDADGLDGSLTITVDQGGEDEASKTVVINDITPIYDLSSNPQISVNEGVSLRIELQTLNVSETSIPYSVSGGIDAADLDDDQISAPLTGGSFSLNGSGYGFLDFHIKADKLTEPTPENLTLTLDGGLGTISVNVVDSSKSPIWDLTTSPSFTVNEGQTLTITLDTQNVDAGDYAYDISGSGFGPEDLEDDSDPLTGDFTVSGSPSTDSITLKIKKDYTSGEGDETITISLPDVDGADDITAEIIDTSNIDPQVGDVIYGNNGAHASLSKDGNFLGIGDSTVTSVRVFKKNELGEWELKQILSGSGYYGEHHSFSSDGSVLAVSDHRLIGDVYVYDWDGSQYNLRGTTPNSNTQTRYGGGISLSGDGLNLFVNSTTTGTYHYFWDGSAWTEKYFIPRNEGHRGYERGLAVSEDAKVLAIGDYKYGATTADGYAHDNDTSSSGAVKVFDWDESNQSWDLRPRVVVPTSQALPYGPYFTWSLSISNGGKLLVVGTHSKVPISWGGHFIFDFNESTEEFEERGTLSGLQSQGYSSDMSRPDSDGNVILVTSGYTNQADGYPQNGYGAVFYTIPASVETYSISGPSSIDEGQDLTLTLNTLGVNGDIAYTISGIADADLDIAGGSASINGVFQVANDTGSITLKILEDADSLDGSLTITVDQGGENEAFKTVTINDITILPETSELNMIEGYGGLGSISPDGTIITSHAIYNAADADVNVRIWSRNPVDSSISSNPIYVITPPSGSSARWGSDHISMNNDGTILAISDLSKNKTYIHEYDSVSDSYILSHTISNPGSENTFGKASISADGTMMVIVGRRDKKVWTYQYSGSSWDLISSATVSISSRIESVSISNYNKTVLVFADQYDQLYTYDWVSSTSSWSQRTGSPLSITNYGESLSLTKDGDILVVGSDGGVIPTWQVYDWNGSQWDLRFTGEDDPTHSAVGAYISSSSIINGYFAVAVTYKRNTSTDFRIINVIETPQNPS